jgi:LacI family transcriptional regulator
MGRLEGYKRALVAHHMKPQTGDIVSIGPSGDHVGDQAGYAATVKLLGNKSRPDGIFCFNDPVALGTMRAVLDAGLRVPEDIAVVGCGNVSYSDFLRVPLTSVDQNSKMIGKIAATLALKLALSKETAESKSVLVQPHLVVRASSLRGPGLRSSEAGEDGVSTRQRGVQADKTARSRGARISTRA